MWFDGKNVVAKKTENRDFNVKIYRNNENELKNESLKGSREKKLFIQRSSKRDSTA